MQQPKGHQPQLSFFKKSPVHANILGNDIFLNLIENLELKKLSAAQREKTGVINT